MKPSIWWRREELNAFVAKRVSDLRAEVQGGRKKKNKQGKSEQTTNAIYTTRHHLVGWEQHANNLVCKTTEETPKSTTVQK